MRSRFILTAAGLGLISLFTTPASSATIFGSKLNHQLTPAESCNANKKADMCSWVLTQAQGDPGNEQAPKNGIVDTVRLMACGPGSFVLQTARAKPGQDKAKVVHTGPLINYVGAGRNCNRSRNFVIEEFPVRVKVKTGDYLSVVATKVSFIYNSSGDGSLVFDPPLPDGGPLVKTDGTGLGSGFLMIQAEYND
jgi:hypothetical protein